MWLVIAGASAFSFAAFMGWRERRELATAAATPAVAASIDWRADDDRRMSERDDDIDWDDDNFPPELEDLL